MGAHTQIHYLAEHTPDTATLKQHGDTTLRHDPCTCRMPRAEASPNVPANFIKWISLVWPLYRMKKNMFALIPVIHQLYWVS